MTFAEEVVLWHQHKVIAWRRRDVRLKSMTHWTPLRRFRPAVLSGSNRRQICGWKETRWPGRLQPLSRFALGSKSTAICRPSY